MTQDELCTQLALACPHWNKDRWNKFLLLTPAEQSLEIQIYQDSSEAAPKSAWAVALQILNVAMQVASAVTGIGGAISAIQTVVKG